jgi:LPS-assembly lipoprotein
MIRLSTILYVVAALVLSGCSYRPLYGSSPGDSNVATSLASISIPEADDRAGQLVRNNLLSSMQAGQSENKYALNLMTTVSDINVVNIRQPGVTRDAILLTVNYELVDKSTGTVVNRGSSFSRASYDVIRQPFADLQAETDATERAALEVSTDIRTRIAAYFAKQQKSS